MDHGAQKVWGACDRGVGGPGEGGDLADNPRGGGQEGEGAVVVEKHADGGVYDAFAAS